MPLILRANCSSEDLDPFDFSTDMLFDLYVRILDRKSSMTKMEWLLRCIVQLSWDRVFVSNGASFLVNWDLLNPYTLRLSQTHHMLRLEHHVTELTKHMVWPARRRTLGKLTPSFGVTERPWLAAVVFHLVSNQGFQGTWHIASGNLQVMFGCFSLFVVINDENMPRVAGGWEILNPDACPIFQCLGRHASITCAHQVSDSFKQKDMVLIKPQHSAVPGM